MLAFSPHSSFGNYWGDNMDFWKIIKKHMRTLMKINFFSLILFSFIVFSLKINFRYTNMISFRWKVKFSRELHLFQTDFEFKLDRNLKSSLFTSVYFYENVILHLLLSNVCMLSRLCILIVNLALFTFWHNCKGMSVVNSKDTWERAEKDRRKSKREKGEKERKKEQGK